MFTFVAILIGGVFATNALIDDETIRLLNTLANFGTIVLLIWRERYLRRHVEPKVDAVVEKVEAVADATGANGWDGNERRGD